MVEFASSKSPRRPEQKRETSGEEKRNRFFSKQMGQPARARGAESASGKLADELFKSVAQERRGGGAKPCQNIKADNTERFRSLLDSYSTSSGEEQAQAASEIKNLLSSKNKDERIANIKGLANTRDSAAWEFLRELPDMHVIAFQAPKVMSVENQAEILERVGSILANETKPRVIDEAIKNLNRELESRGIAQVQWSEGEISSQTAEKQETRNPAFEQSRRDEQKEVNPDSHSVSEQSNLQALGESKTDKTSSPNNTQTKSETRIWELTSERQIKNPGYRISSDQSFEKERKRRSTEQQQERREFFIEHTKIYKDGEVLRSIIEKKHEETVAQRDAHYDAWIKKVIDESKKTDHSCLESEQSKLQAIKWLVDAGILKVENSGIARLISEDEAIRKMRERERTQKRFGLSDYHVMLATGDWNEQKKEKGQKVDPKDEQREKALQEEVNRRRANAENAEKLEKAERELEKLKAQNSPAARKIGLRPFGASQKKSSGNISCHWLKLAL